MTNPGINIQVLDDFADLVNEVDLTEAVAVALVAGSAENDANVSVVIADDELVRELNYTHRGLNEHTDVLAFSFTHEGDYYGEEPQEVAEDMNFVLPPGESEPLGEVIVSYPQAQRQADVAGHSLEKELTVLLIHGTLHLLGHDHMEPDDEAIMKPLEAQALAAIQPPGV
ncbi:MAG: rRNA maturation RNase YbeY [SAR202 cluster bacterium]|nr:rRNA maturation RNase YbeY [SAR202 cluster bacterium]